MCVMFSFASKVLNTLIGDEEQQQQQQQSGLGPSPMGPYRPPHQGPPAPVRPGPPFGAPFGDHGPGHAPGPPAQFRYGAPLMPAPQRMSSGASFGSFQQQRPLRPQPPGMPMGMGPPPTSRFGTPGDHSQIPARSQEAFTGPTNAPLYCLFPLPYILSIPRIMLTDIRGKPPFICFQRRLCSLKI